MIQGKICEFKREFSANVVFTPESQADCLGLYGQVKKRIRWMPWQSEAMKDVVACDKLRGVGKQTVIRRSLNGGTHSAQAGYLALNP